MQIFNELNDIEKNYCLSTYQQVFHQIIKITYQKMACKYAFFAPAFLILIIHFVVLHPLVKDKVSNIVKFAQSFWRRTIAVEDKDNHQQKIVNA